MNFLYVFGIYDFIDPAEYQLALTIFYETDSDYYASTFLNETIEVVDHSRVMDFQMCVVWRMNEAQDDDYRVLLGAGVLRLQVHDIVEWKKSERFGQRG